MKVYIINDLIKAYPRLLIVSLNSLISAIKINLISNCSKVLLGFHYLSNMQS